MAKRRKKSSLTEEERKAVGARLAAARKAAREKRIEVEQPQEENPFKDAKPVKKEVKVQVQETANPWKQAALAMLRAVRRQVFEICTCKSKAYMNRCERYSCRHLLDAIKHLDGLAVQGGLLPPMKLHMPRFDNHGTPPFRSDRPLKEQHTTSIDPEARAYDESGMPVTPVGRGQGLEDFGPRTFEVKIGS